MYFVFKKYILCSGLIWNANINGRVIVTLEGLKLKSDDSIYAHRILWYIVVIFKNLKNMYLLLNFGTFRLAIIYKLFIYVLYYSVIRLNINIFNRGKMNQNNI